MLDILALMIRLNELKRTARTGWNMPATDRTQARHVPNAESVAGHSWGLAMMALAIAHELNLDANKMVKMALVHDVAEFVTGDVVIATLPPDEREQAKKKKRIAEQDAMRDIFLPHGKFGQMCLDLWHEYEDGSSPEARVLHELDKLEACIQAVLYQREGHAVQPNEFLAYTEGIVRTPELVAMLKTLRVRLDTSNE